MGAFANNMRRKANNQLPRTATLPVGQYLIRKKITWRNFWKTPKFLHFTSVDIQTGMQAFRLMDGFDGAAYFDKANAEALLKESKATNLQMILVK